MKVTMSEQESNQIDKMFKQHTQMYDMLSELREAVVGNPEYKRIGIIDEIQLLKAAVKEHDESDTKKFQIIFDYQKKQQLFVGWSGVLVRGGWALFLVAVGYFIDRWVNH